VYFNLEKFLGSGSFGSVMLGKLLMPAITDGMSETLEMPVAVKTLNKEQRNLENMRSLCNELRISMTIRHGTPEQHPNVVRFVGAVTTGFQKSNTFNITLN